MEVNREDGLFVYNLDYYDSHLNQIEELHEGEIMVGPNVKMTRKHVKCGGKWFNMHSYHTHLVDVTKDLSELRATICIVHGYGENSDIHLEQALQYALNGFEVHLIDLTGYGMTGGTRMAGFTVHDFHYNVTTLLA